MATNFQIVIDDLERTVNTAIVALVLDIQAGLILLTPVDTGHAQNNWVSSIGSPIAGTPGNNKSIAGKKWSMEMGPLYIVNNVNYIEVLNAGHSQQAPAGFVDAIVSVNMRAFNRKKLS